MALRPMVYAAGEYVIRKGEPGKEMYFLARGQVEVLGDSGPALATLQPGDFFGELSLLLSQPRTACSWSYCPHSAASSTRPSNPPCVPPWSTTVGRRRLPPARPWL